MVKNNFVQYGQEIFLMHADSKSFVNGLILASDSDKSAYKLQLSTNF